MGFLIRLPVYKRDPNLWIRAFEGPQAGCAGNAKQTHDK